MAGIDRAPLAATAQDWQRGDPPDQVSSLDKSVRTNRIASKWPAQSDFRGFVASLIAHLRIGEDSAVEC